MACELLHSTSYSSVFLGASSHASTSSSSGPPELACYKVYHKAFPLQPRHWLNISRECAILHRLREDRVDGVVQLLSVADTPHCFSLQFSLCRGGTLHQRLDAAGGPPSEADLCTQVVAPLLRVLVALHARGVVHRDVKPENVFLEADGRLVLGDFGLAIDTSPAGGGARPVSRVGTEAFMAPEVLAQPSADAIVLRGIRASALAPYTSAVDIWAVGVLTHEALTGSSPFAAPSAELMCLRAQYGPAARLPDAVSAECRDFVGAALQKVPAKRPSAAQLLSHPWIVKQEAAKAGGSGGSALLAASPKPAAAPAAAAAIATTSGASSSNASSTGVRAAAPARAAHAAAGDSSSSDDSEGGVRQARGSVSSDDSSSRSDRPPCPSAPLPRAQGPPAAPAGTPPDCAWRCVRAAHPQLQLRMPALSVPAPPAAGSDSGSEQDAMLLPRRSSQSGTCSPSVAASACAPGPAAHPPRSAALPIVPSMAPRHTASLQHGADATPGRAAAARGAGPPVLARCSMLSPRRPAMLLQRLRGLAAARGERQLPAAAAGGISAHISTHAASSIPWRRRHSVDLPMRLAGGGGSGRASPCSPEPAAGMVAGAATTRSSRAGALPAPLSPRCAGTGSSSGGACHGRSLLATSSLLHGRRAARALREGRQPHAMPGDAVLAGVLNSHHAGHGCCAGATTRPGVPAAAGPAKACTTMMGAARKMLQHVLRHHPQEA